MAQEKSAERKKNKSLAWLIFFLSTVGLAVAIITHWEWLTMIIPFWVTSFVIAMDLM